jgi:hypothetical protein
LNVDCVSGRPARGPSNTGPSNDSPSNDGRPALSFQLSEKLAPFLTLVFRNEPQFNQRIVQLIGAAHLKIRVGHS